MCLLMKVSKDSKFSNEFLADVYANNSDGLGVMWHNAENKLQYAKVIPKNAKEAIKFFRKHAEGKDCIVHFRFATHGTTADHNTHPYPIMGFEGTPDHEVPMMLAHNGILSTGNAKDTERSDTYWYITDYLYPLLSKNPDLINQPSFIAMVGAHIGTGNKFAIMDNLGNTAIVNEDQFVEYEGSLLSNTYAYDAIRFGVTKPYYGGGYKGYGYGGGYGYGSKGYWDDDYYEPVGKKQPAVTAKATTDYEDSMEFQYAELFMDMLNEREYWESYANLSHQELSAYYVEDPEAAEHLLIALEDGSISDVDILEFFDTISYNKSFGYHQDTEDRLGAAA